MTLRGTTGEFPLETVLRLLADTKKTGELSIRGKNGEGALGIAEGRVVTAVYGDEQPIPSLGAIFQISDAEFEFTPWTEAPPSNLEGDLQDNLRKAGEYREWLTSVRQVIPHDDVRFRLSERAAEAGAVTFTSDRWRVVLAVNGQRDVNDMATYLHVDRDSTLTILAGLVRDGVIDAIDDAAPAPAAEPPPAPAEPEPAPPPAAVEPEPTPAMVEPEPAPPPVAVEPPAPTFEAPPAPEPVLEPPPPAPAPEPVKESDWTAALLRDTAPSETAEPTAPPPPAPLEPAVPAAQEWGAPEPVAPSKEWNPPAEEWAPPAPARPEPAPAPIDDRLAALFGTPAPAAGPAAAPPSDPWSTPATDRWTTPAPAADQWTTPAQSAEAPPAEADPRLGALAPMKEAEAATPTPSPSEWAPPPEIEAPAPKKKGMFGRFRKEEAAPTPAGRAAAVDSSASSRAGMLAAFSNALLSEYNSGQYGKGRVEDRIPSLLMRVDEQADPIDKPLPVVDDRLDVQALERVALPEQQAVPYLAMLVSTIYGDAEKAFGRDKAKRGYRAAQQRVFAGDTSALGGPDVAGKLPKI